MRRLGAVVRAAAVAGALLAADRVVAQATGLGDEAVPALVLQGSSQFDVPHSLAPSREAASEREELMRTIAAWLSSGLGFPDVEILPTLRFEPPARLIALRYGEPDALTRAGQPDVVALYDNRTQTIHLQQAWSGGTVAELSVLVHEMVHHVQNVAGLKFACEEEREEQAFRAQQRWLQLFGSDLATEFGLDPFRLLVRTTCRY